MARPRARTALGHWTAQLPWLLPPVVELPVVAALCSALPQVGRAGLAGTPGSQVVLLIAVLVAVAGFAAQAGGVGGTPRVVAGCALAVTAGVVAALGVGFGVGAYPLVGVLTAHSALATAMLARAALRDPQ